ncbi:MAG: GMC family oxidoreductase [Anaerolineae bacterium]|nr:GMC family oxidoreductase [Anaerolineae bacterium]
MLEDANKLNSAQIITTDICIVGSGPAGITLAMEFDKTPYKVTLLESGDLHRDRDRQRLNDAELTGDPYQYPRFTRRRQFGGAANQWGAYETSAERIGVRHMPYEPIEFEQRDWIPHSGWPFDRTHLDPYYERAHKISELGPYNYEPEAWQTDDAKPLPLAGDTLTSGVYQFAGFKSFTERHHALQASKNITLILNATVQEVALDAGGTNATGLIVKNANNADLRVTAKIVVLAVGGIETPRLLLLSRSKQTNGIGNQNDVVGRYFMDHPFSVGAVLTPNDRTLLDRLNFYDNRLMNGTFVLGRFTLSEAAIRREKLMSMSFWLYPTRPPYLSKAWESYYMLWEQFITRSRPSDLGTHAKNMLTGLGSLAQIAAYRAQGKHYYFTHEKGAWSKLPNKSDLFSLIEIRSQLEQSPDPDNRITLSDNPAFVDAFGQRHIHIHWRYHREDEGRVRRARVLVQEEFQRSGIGTLVYPEPLYWRSGNHHHMGTARMGTDPKTSVVDPNLKVHDVSNLYIASSAVFPTGGYGNPTLTISALAIRLADHLKKQLQ